MTIAKNGNVQLTIKRFMLALKLSANKGAGAKMIVNVPTEIIPIWYIEKWVKEEAEPNSALDMFIRQMLKDWKAEEFRQSMAVKHK